MRISQIALYTRNIERMSQFYTTYFDAAICSQRVEPKNGARTCCLDFQDGTKIKLICMQNDVERHMEGSIGISFSAGGRDAVNELTLRLGDAGFEILAGPFEMDSVYMSSVLDPEENQIDITE